MERPQLGVYLKTARSAAGLTQEELGKLLGYGPDYVRKVEGGNMPPSIRILLGCAIIFGKSVSELFPAFTRELQDEIAKNAAAFDQAIRNRTDATSLKQADLLRSMVPRLTDNPPI
jgi:transcriptional regulator with XRE-family HTH domain